MKGAFVVSNEDYLYAQIEHALVAEGGRASDEHVVQVDDENGVLFTVYGNLGPAFEVDLTVESTETRGNGAAPPVPTIATSCWAECRSEETFVRWIGVIAAARPEPTWVLDGNGVFWRSTALDPAGLSL